MGDTVRRWWRYARLAGRETWRRWIRRHFGKEALSVVGIAAVAFLLGDERTFEDVATAFLYGALAVAFVAGLVFLVMLGRATMHDDLESLRPLPSMVMELRGQVATLTERASTLDAALLAMQRAEEARFASEAQKAADPRVRGTEELRDLLHRHAHAMRYIGASKDVRLNPIGSRLVHEVSRKVLRRAVGEDAAMRLGKAIEAQEKNTALVMLPKRGNETDYVWHMRVYAMELDAIARDLTPNHVRSGFQVAEDERAILREIKTLPSFEGPPPAP